MTPPAQASPFVTDGIAALAIVIAVLAVAIASRVNPAYGRPAAIGITALMALQFGLAASGMLQRWNQFPAPLLPLVGGTFLLTGFALWRWGARFAEGLSFGILIGSQIFRLPLEFVMHRAAVEGVMPVQMSYSGQSFDILTGATAIVVAGLAIRGLAPLWLLFAWNLAGSLLLINIVTIAILSTPLFRTFGDGQMNTWVADAPFVWLPGILVPAAIFGHGVIWRKLLST